MEKNESTFLIVQIEVPELKLIRPAGQTWNMSFHICVVTTVGTEMKRPHAFSSSSPGGLPSFPPQGVGD